MSNNPIITERIFNAPVEKVWKAITDKDEMKNWYFKLDAFKAEPGFKFQFTGGSETQQYLHLCEITEVIPERKLTYSWRYEGYPGISYVSFELTPQGDKTLLVLTHEGVESFVAGGPDFAKESFTKGWTYIVHTGLKNYLEPADTTK